MNRYFWYERNFCGKYCPVASPEDPRESGYKKKLQRYSFTELKPDEATLELKILSRIYPPPEDQLASVEPVEPKDPTPLDNEAEADVEETENNLT